MLYNDKKKKPFKNRTANGESNENQLLYYPPLTPRLFTTLVAALFLLTGCMTGDDSKTTEYKLSFSANGGTGEMESITKEENEKINLPAVKFSRTGFEFLNWNTVADGSGTSYTDGAEFTFNTDTMLHAQWKEKKAAPSNPENPDQPQNPENPTKPQQPQTPETPSTPKTTYTVIFDANGGNGTIASISVEEGSEITLPENTFTKTGYSFAGWATYADGNVLYSDKAKIPITGNITLYAKWTAITYTITYEPNGGTNADGNPAGYTSETETITLLAPSREYFDFGGWYTDSEFSDSSRKTEIAKGSSGNITLYVKWTVAAENAVNAINSLPTGEHKIAVTGQMTKDNLNGVIAAIKGNLNGAKVYLDLGGTAIDFYDWQRCKFADCENLIGIVIPAIESPDKNNPIILIPDLMFEGCKNLKSVIILNSSGEYKIITFKDCTSLEYVEIPTSIVCIYGDAFDGCTALGTITYKGTVEQWKQVKTDYKNSKYKLMSLGVQCENGTARGSDLIKE